VINNYTRALDITVSGNNYSKTANIPVNGAKSFVVSSDGTYTVRHSRSVGSGYSDYYGYYSFKKDVSVSGEKLFLLVLIL
jgi:hypothetical protein